MKKEGFWLIDKPKGWTSFDVCAKMRKILNVSKVGHTGTLDPFATGLLLVATGKTTKLIPFLEKFPKTYVARILLGCMSQTLDSESEIFSVMTPEALEPSLFDIQNILDRFFLGKISQIPPQFSALKKNGKKAYDLARKGEKVDLEARNVEIFRTKILFYSFPFLDIELEVSSGFYVRSFARDLGTALCGGGICQELRRTYIGDLSLSDAEKIDHLSEAIDPQFVLKSFPVFEIPLGRVQDFVAGRAFPFFADEGEKFLVLAGGVSLGIGEIFSGKLQPRIVL